MRVIAINDSPLNDEIKKNIRMLGLSIERAYKKGDIFEVLSVFSNCYVIYHPIIDKQISVDSRHFISLSEWRNKQIDSIIDEDI